MCQKRILIVDDDRLLLRLLEDQVMLCREDCQVSCARDAPTALRKLEQERFDLVLTDYHMPGMDGLELAQVVRQAAPCMPVVLMTAHWEGAELQDRIKALGLAGYLRKPFGLKQICAILQTSLHGAW